MLDILRALLRSMYAGKHLRTYIWLNSDSFTLFESPHKEGILIPCNLWKSVVTFGRKAGSSMNTNFIQQDKAIRFCRTRRLKPADPPSGDQGK